MIPGWDHEVDVVCVGSGIGGCATAMAARSAGLSVLIVEKTAELGGVTAHSGGQLWLPGSHHATQAGLADSVADGAGYITQLAGVWADPDWTSQLLTNANEALLFFEKEHGVRFALMKGQPDYYYPGVAHSLPEGRYLEPQEFDVKSLGAWADRLRRTPEQRAGGVLGRTTDATDEDIVYTGAALAGYFLRGAIEAGAEIWTDSPVTGLATENGTVVGVHIDGGARSVRARRGVVLATGAYDWNKEFQRRYEGALDEPGSLAPEGITGDHLVFASAIGAAIRQMPPQRNVMTGGFPLGQTGEDGLPQYMIYWAAGPHEIVVNRAGERFADESFYPAMQSGAHVFKAHAMHGNPNWPAWLIFDADYWSAKRRDQQPAPPADVIISAQTLAELADKVGIDADGLVASVDRFNAMCDTGRDDDFHRGEVFWVRAQLSLHPAFDPNQPVIGPIRRGPFYAAKLARIHVGVASAGLEIDRSGRVLTLAGEAIKGLYAVGNSSGRNDLGIALQSGLPNMRGMTYGYLAARHIAGKNSPDSVSSLLSEPVRMA